LRGQSACVVVAGAFAAYDGGSCQVTAVSVNTDATIWVNLNFMPRSFLLFGFIFEIPHPVVGRLHKIKSRP
jgi:hypothetical protein